MDLSESHAEKWPPLLEHAAPARSRGCRQSEASPREADVVHSLRQKQRRLDKDEIERLIAAYKAGSTVYQLAERWGCHRTTVSQCLKSHGVRMRRVPPSEKQLDDAARLYESGLSLARVGREVGCHPDTLWSHLRQRGVAMRDPHDRRRSR